MYFQRGVLETIVRELTVLLGKRERKKKKGQAIYSNDYMAGLWSQTALFEF